MTRAVAVTGGSGFIGSHLCEELVADSAMQIVYVLDKVPPRMSHSKIRFIETDITQPIHFKPEIPVSSCFHLAAACREPGFEWNEYFLNNYTGTKMICAWLTEQQIENVIFTSTAMVFKAEEVRHAESDLINANTAYGISKALAEETMQGWLKGDRRRRLNVVRPGVVFGRGSGGNFVNLHKALSKGIFCYIGKSSTVKSCIYVKDLVRLLLKVETSEQEGATYHGVYPEATTIKSICAAFCSIYGWHRWIPTVPMKLALVGALPFQALNELGLKNPIHYRRIEKLFYSTNLSASGLQNIGFSAQFSLDQAIADWRKDCSPLSLY